MSYRLGFSTYGADDFVWLGADVQVEGVAIMVVITSLGIAYGILVYISKRYYIRTTMVRSGLSASCALANLRMQALQSWGFGASWMVTLLSVALAPVLLQYSLWWQLQYIAYFWVLKAAGALLFFFVFHYWCGSGPGPAQHAAVTHIGATQGIYLAEITVV